MRETKLLAYGMGTLESWKAFQEGRRKYPGVKRFTIDYTGERAVARPVRSTSPVEQEHQRLSRRLREISAQEQRDLAHRLSGTREPSHGAREARPSPPRDRSNPVGHRPASPVWGGVV